MKAVRALPGPLVDALTDGKHPDPGMLLTYPRTDLKLLGLNGSGLASTDECCGDGGGSPVVDLGSTYDGTLHDGVHATHIARTCMDRAYGIQ